MAKSGVYGGKPNTFHDIFANPEPSLESVILPSVQEAYFKSEVRYAEEKLKSIGVETILFDFSMPRGVLTYELNKLKKKMRECDTFLFVYNGHGTEGGVYTNYNVGNVVCISDNQLRKISNELPGRSIFVLDGCEAGALAKNIVRPKYGTLPKNTLSIGSTYGKEPSYNAIDKFTKKFFDSLVENNCNVQKAFDNVGFGSLYKSYDIRRTDSMVIPCNIQCGCPLKG
ncbi:MAG: caspase family protein [Candidatus Aenigmarchaeota archaeon]|nr:caspase family protein [Candidatus Aenigmarchaeota archaeon]